MSEKHRIREKKFSLYLLEEEYELLKKGAFEYDLSLSDYIRQLIVASEIIGRHWTMDKEQGKQFLHEINRIANSLNIIAYSTRDKSVSDDTWKEVKSNYFELLDLLGQVPFLDKTMQIYWSWDATQYFSEHCSG